jgi:ribosomal protein L20
MSRIKRGVTTRAKHKRILDQAKGYRGRRKNTIRVARQAVEKAGQYAYRDRKVKKRTFRALWIQRINAAVRAEGLTYSQFIHGVKLAGIELDRKAMADLAMNEGGVFNAVIAQAKAAPRRLSRSHREPHQRALVRSGPMPFCWKIRNYPDSANLRENIADLEAFAARNKRLWRFVTDCYSATIPKGRAIASGLPRKGSFPSAAPGAAPYFTTFYLTEIDIPDGQRVQDHLHPEWANLRLFQGTVPEAEIAGAKGPPGIAAIGTGPTSTTIRFTAGRCRIWGIGLLPLGWAKFARAPAHLWADRIFDPCAEPDFAQFGPLIDGVFGACVDEAAELERITAFFAARADMPAPDEDRIVAIHGAIVDPETGSVADVAEATGLASYTIERICRRYFGFARACCCGSASCAVCRSTCSIPNSSGSARSTGTITIRRSSFATSGGSWG